MTVLGVWLPRYSRCKRTDKGNSVYDTSFFSFFLVLWHVWRCLALILHILELPVHGYRIRKELSWDSQIRANAKVEDVNG